MKIIIDRFEGEYAIVEMENGKLINIPRVLLPEKATEGDVIQMFIDREKTETRKKEIKKKLNNLFVD